MSHVHFRAIRGVQGGQRGAGPPPSNLQKNNMSALNRWKGLRQLFLFLFKDLSALERHFSVWLISLKFWKQHILCIKVEGPWRESWQVKKPFQGLILGSCWEEREKRVFPQWVVIDLPSRQINHFLPIWPSWYFIACALLSINVCFTLEIGSVMRLI